MAQVQDQREIPNLQGLGLPDALVRAIRRIYGIAYDIRDQVRTQHIYSLAYQGTAQSIANNAATKLTFNTNAYVSDALHVAGSGDFIATTAGLYKATGQVQWATSALGTLRQIMIYVNGAQPKPGPFNSIGVANVELSQQVVSELYLKQGDAVQFMVLQDSGGSLNTVANETYGALSLLVKQSG